MRRSSKVDANQSEIVSALRQVGCTVTSLHRVGGGVPDLLVGRAGMTYLMEVKNPDGGRVLPEQEAWHNAWNGTPVSIVSNVPEAMAAIGVRVQ